MLVSPSLCIHLFTNKREASGDLCNLIESVIALPEGFDKTCLCVLNDQDPAVVSRNIVMLLITVLLPPPIATESVLHVWYSARLTADMVQSLQRCIKPLIADIVRKIADRTSGVLYSKPWTFDKGTVSARLYKEQWSFMLALLEKDHNVDTTEKSRKEVMLNHTRLDHRERSLVPLSPSRRVCAARMRQEGILLPFGSCLASFSFPNP